MDHILSELNPVCFWDVDKSKLDSRMNADYIIRRVFELGDIEEIGFVHGVYGTERCREALLTTEALRESAIVQGMLFLDIPDRSLFKCGHKIAFYKL